MQTYANTSHDIYCEGLFHISKCNLIKFNGSLKNKGGSAHHRSDGVWMEESVYPLKSRQIVLGTAIYDSLNEISIIYLKLQDDYVSIQILKWR